MKFFLIILIIRLLFAWFDTIGKEEEIEILIDDEVKHPAEFGLRE
jgi:hypothetical protein